MSTDSNNSGNGLDLSDLNFGPSWARDKPTKKDYSNYEVKERPQRSGKKGGGRPQQGNRDNNNRGPRRDGGHQNKGGGRRFDERRPRFEPVPAPEGFSGEIMPIEDGLDRLSKQILSTSRTYSVFDLARLVLQARDRFNVGLRAPKGTKLYRNIATFATFMTKEEAMQDFWKSEIKERFYQAVEKETDAPAGNFPSVAKCSKTGVYIGPPNHHSYQTKLREHHQENFPTLPFEVYQRQIVVEQGEEAVAAWIESAKIQTFYLPLSAVPASNTPATTAPEEATEATDSTEAAETSPESNEDTSEPAAEETSAPEETTPEADEAPEIDDSLLLKTRTELEHHFSTNHFDQAYKQVQISWVPSTIAGKLLSPGLLSLLKDTVSEERRYPGKLASLMCRQLSGRNIAVFKLNKKLKAGPSRPHAIPSLDTLAARPKAILEWTQKNDGAGVDKLWSELLAKDITEEEKAEWFHDLKWLLSQGYASLLEDGQLFFSKKEDASDTPKAKKSKKPAKPKPEAKQEPKQEAPQNDEAKADDKPADAPATTASAEPAAEAPIAEQTPETEPTTEAPPVDIGEPAELDTELASE